MMEPAWITVAKSYLGFHETGNNQGIGEFIKLAHTGEEGNPWCAIFANACLEKAGYTGTKSAAARSFTSSEHFIKLEAPKLGAITVIWRGSPGSSSGHVFFFMGQNEKGIYALGGNQQDQVEYEYQDPHKVLGHYWPKDGPEQVEAPPLPVTSTEWTAGRGSWFSQYKGKYAWVDTGDKPGSNALHVPDSQQGIAFYNHATLGKWFDIQAPNGRVLKLRQTDIGPHPRTGRTIDIAAVAAERFGYSPHNFPTDGIFRWRPHMDENLSDSDKVDKMPQNEPATPAQPTLNQADAERIAAALVKVQQPMIAALLPVVMGALPQLGVWGIVLQGILMAVGQMGNLTGEFATPTSQSTMIALAGAVVSGVLHRVLPNGPSPAK